MNDKRMMGIKRHKGTKAQRHKAEVIRRRGLVLPLVAVAMVVLSVIGLGVLTVAFGVRLDAARTASEAVAMLAAEAGYEEAVFWMSGQQDMLYIMKNGGDYTDSLTLPDASCEYTVSFYSFLGSRPAYRIHSVGHSGRFARTVNVVVLQEISGWDMGMCRVPSDLTSTYPVNFADGETIDFPLHINRAADSPDERDIFISGSPVFLQEVSMGESRHTAGGADKYTGIIDLFQQGIYFDQPNSRITDETALALKLDRFRTSTSPSFSYAPIAGAAVDNPQPAIQVEFFVESGAGKLRITDNCTVRGFRQASSSRTWDFRIKSGTGQTEYEMYDIYAYHLAPADANTTGERLISNVEDCYVTQSIGDAESQPGGQIYVDGNVIIGGVEAAQMLKGMLTIVATGNIWIADSLRLDGPHDVDGRPSMDNPNALALIAQGVVRAVDPGMSEYSHVDGNPVEPAGFVYAPIGIPDTGEPDDSHHRHLPDPLVIEAAITIGGGGLGAENVRRTCQWVYQGGNWVYQCYGDRKEASSPQDGLYLYGAISEAIRGVVGLVGTDGYLKNYYFDSRLMEGILPGDIWLKGKYIPAPAGWSDYR